MTNKKLTVRCKTMAKVRQVLDILHSQGHRWCTGQSLNSDLPGGIQKYFDEGETVVIRYWTGESGRFPDTVEYSHLQFYMGCRDFDLMGSLSPLDDEFGAVTVDDTLLLL